jgi:hypothetical protein
MFPRVYVYPRAMQTTRDLLRRREYFVRHQAELFTHIENTIPNTTTTGLLGKPISSGHTARRAFWPMTAIPSG